MQRCGATGRLTPAAVREIDETPTGACGGNLRPAAVPIGEMLPKRKVLGMERAFTRPPPELIRAAQV